MIDEFDVIVFQRPPSAHAVELMQYAKSEGKKVVFELDDDPWRMNPDNPATACWKQDWLDALEKGAARADLVTTTTKHLAQTLGRFSDNVAILPNCLPSQLWRTKKPHFKKRIIGYAGGRAHYDDVALLRDAIPQVLEARDDVEFHLAGLDGWPVADHERVLIRPTVCVEDFGQLLAEFDIGLAPLTDTAFNRAKSDIKIVELAAAGAIPLASNVGPYKNKTKCARLVRKGDSWAKAILAALDAPDEERLRYKAYAESRTIERNVWMWEKAYGIGDWKATRANPVNLGDLWPNIKAIERLQANNIEKTCEKCEEAFISATMPGPLCPRCQVEKTRWDVQHPLDGPMWRNCPICNVWHQVEPILNGYLCGKCRLEKTGLQEALATEVA